MDHHDQSPIGRLATAIRLGMDRLSEPWRNSSLGLCLSGGTDSCALAIAAWRASNAQSGLFPGGVTAYHVRHALRGSESDGDAASVRELCGRLGVALVELDAKIEPGPGLEARAREARYHCLREAAGPDCLLVTAHHLEDQAETVMLRLLRGAGPVGLRGIHAFRSDGIWRPFLDCSRRDLISACQEFGWAPRQDSSNCDTSFERNNLRHRVLPELEAQFPGYVHALVALGNSAQRLEIHLERALDRLGRSVGFQVDSNGFSLDLSSLPESGSAAEDPELEILMERAWTRCGRRPWAKEHRRRLLADAASLRVGRRLGGQGEQAIWGGGKLRIECLDSPARVSALAKFPV